VCGSQSSEGFLVDYQKKNCADRAISAICTGDASVVTTPDDLCAAFKAFCVDLFPAELINNSLKDKLFLHVSAVSSIDSAMYKGPLTLQECFSALSCMAQVKTPGCDGLPMEFSLKF